MNHAFSRFPIFRLSLAARLCALPCLALGLALGGPAAQAARQAGDTAPDFQARASLAGKDFDYSLQAALKKGPVVVYFYPAAFTGGCSLQAHTFAVNQDKFAAAGASIVGVSLDDIGRLNEFSADPESCGGKIPVASDAEGRIAKAYDLSVREASAGRKDNRGAEIAHGLAERTTFVVGADGRVKATLSGLSPTDNVEQALAQVQQLASQRR
jgi:peroxiredoxin Q/BCP